MREIEIKDNPLGLRIFVNGMPEIKNIGNEELEIIVQALEKQIDDYYKDKKTKKGRQKFTMSY